MNQEPNKIEIDRMLFSIDDCPTVTEPNTLEYRVVKRRWFHGLIDWIHNPTAACKLGTITISFDIMCEKSGNIFIRRHI